MSRLNHNSTIAKFPEYAAVFAALGDETRLSLVTKLAKGQACSISQLTEGLKLTRQAVTKHLKVLENVGIVQSTYSGRENRFELDIESFKNIKEYLECVSYQWEQALSRLRSFIEK